MHLQIVIAVCALVASSAAETKFPDGTYIQHFPPTGNSLATTNHLAPQPLLPHGFGVQTGYEGYLIPSQSASQGGWWHRGLLAGLLPLAKLALAFPFASGLGILTLIIGSTLFCHFTPLCGFSILGLGRTYLNQESLNSATAFVMDAIEKHRDLQKKPVAAKESKGNKNAKETKEA